MFNFIIVDDYTFFLELVEKIIDKIMKKNKYHYKCYKFSEYDSGFNKIAKMKLNNKIYIFDIETPKNNGINIARKIREKDFDCEFIFLSSYEQKYYGDLLRCLIHFYCFVSKSEIDSLLEDCINKLLKTIEKNETLSIIDNYTKYIIPFKNILFITTEERKTLVITDSEDILLSKSFNYINTFLSTDFVTSHRCCTVNTKRIFKITKNFIYFDNGFKCNKISDKYKNNVLEKLGIK